MISRLSWSRCRSSTRPRSCWNVCIAASEAHDILRIKGFVPVSGKALRLAVQGVGRRFRQHFDQPWPAGARARRHAGGDRPEGSRPTRAELRPAFSAGAERMHLLAREVRTLDDEQGAVDLGQTPADVVFLSFSDSDLGAAAAAWQAMAPPRPSLRLASLARLRHPMSVDLYVEQTSSGRAVRGRASAGRARLLALRRRGVCRPVPPARDSARDGARRRARGCPAG